MQQAYIVTGTTADGRTVVLDEPLPAGVTRLRLVIEPLPTEGGSRYAEVMAAIRARQRADGFVPPSAAEVHARLREERESWDEE